MSSVNKLKSYFSNLASKAGLSSGDDKKNPPNQTPSSSGGYPGTTSQPAPQPASNSPYATTEPPKQSSNPSQGSLPPQHSGPYQPQQPYYNQDAFPEPQRFDAYNNNQYPPAAPMGFMIPTPYDNYDYPTSQQFPSANNYGYHSNFPAPGSPYQQQYPEMPAIPGTQQNQLPQNPNPNPYNPYNSQQQGYGYDTQRPASSDQLTQNPAISIPVLQTGTGNSRIGGDQNVPDQQQATQQSPQQDSQPQATQQEPQQRPTPTQAVDEPNIPITTLREDIDNLKVSGDQDTLIQQHSHNPPATSPNDPSHPAPIQQGEGAQRGFWGSSENQKIDPTIAENQLQGQSYYENATATGKITFINAKNGELVHHRFLVLQGKVETGSEENGTITVIHPYFPYMEYEVKSGNFKAIVELESGDNNLVFTYRTAKGEKLEQKLVIKMQPNLQNPPLQIAIVLGKDSVGMYDIDPEKVSPPQEWLQDSVNRLRCAVYLWQSFIAEQMRRNGYGWRTFRLEEEYTPDTMTNRDNYSRMNLKIHVLRSELTVSEIQDKERAQQWNPPPGYKRKIDESQFDVAGRAIDAYGGPLKGDRRYIAALSIDSHWSPSLKVALGHAALGGGTDARRLGVFGSHLTYAWPSCIEEIVPFFNDTTKVNTKYISDDGNNGLGYWRSANVGIGAFLHEVGHLLTMPHTPSGIMMRGFDNFNRTFCVSEPGNSGPILPGDEAGAHWHRTDIIRLRYHPLFMLPGERQYTYPSAKPVTYIAKSGLLIECRNGISMIECYVNDSYRSHAEFTRENLTMRQDGRIPTFTPEERMMENPTWASIDLNYWKQLAYFKETDNVRFEITSKQQELTVLDNVYEFMRKKTITTPTGVTLYSTAVQGREPDGVEGNDGLFMSDNPSFLKIPKNSRLLSLSKIRAVNTHFNVNNSTISAIEFVTVDGKSTFIGNKGTKGSKVSKFDIPDDDGINTIVIRSGYWVDGFEFKTRKGRSSGWIGGNGGSIATIQAPLGYVITGMRAYAGDWIDGLIVFYSRIE